VHRVGLADRMRPDERNLPGRRHPAELTAPTTHSTVGRAAGGEVLAAERVVAALGDAVVSEAAGEIELKAWPVPSPFIG